MSQKFKVGQKVLAVTFQYETDVLCTVTGYIKGVPFPYRVVDNWGRTDVFDEHELLTAEDPNDLLKEIL